MEASSYQKEVRQAARAGALLVGVGGITGVANLLFNVVVARGSGTSGYGAIGPLLMLGTVAGFLVTGLQYAIARVVALSDRPARHLLGTAARAAVPWLLPSILLALLAVPVTGFLHLDSPVPVLLVATMAGCMVAGAAASGVLIGRRRFQVIAALLLGSALLRVGLGFLLGHGDGAVAGSILASLIPVLVVAILSLLVVLYWHNPVDSHAPSVKVAGGSDRVGGSGVVGALVSGALWTIWSVPLLFARHLLAPTAAGDFAAAQLLAGGIIWITGPLVTAFYPTIARHRHWSSVAIGMVATAGICLVGLGGLTVLGPSLIGLLYGDHFSGTAGFFAILALSATATACATFGCWVVLARRRLVRPTVTGLAVALALEIGLDAMFAHTRTVLAAGPAVAIALSAGIVAVAVLLYRTRGRQSLVRTPETSDEPVFSPVSTPVGTDL